MTTRLDPSVAHTTVSGERSNSSEKLGSATLTMEKSIVAMNVPNPTAIRVRHFRGSRVSAVGATAALCGPAPRAATDAGVVAGRMACLGRVAIRYEIAYSSVTVKVRHRGSPLPVSAAERPIASSSTSAVAVEGPEGAATAAATLG